MDPTKRARMLPPASSLVRSASGAPPLPAARTLLHPVTPAAPPPAGVGRAVNGISGGNDGEQASFDRLLSEIVTHPAAALLMHSAFTTASGGDAPSVDGPSGAALRDVEAKIHRIVDIARVDGIAEACRHSSSLDVFLAAFYSSIKMMRGNPVQPLHATLTACAAKPAVESVMTTRPKLSASARDKMEKWFNDHFENPYPTDEEKKNLAEECGIHLNQVNNYFGNRRMRMKRKIIQKKLKEEAASHGAPAPSYESSVLAPRTKWRAIVLPEATTRGRGRPVSTSPPDHTVVNGLYRGEPSSSRAVPIPRFDAPRYPTPPYVSNAHSTLPVSHHVPHPPPQAPHPSPRPGQYEDAPHPVVRFAPPRYGYAEQPPPPRYIVPPPHPRRFMVERAPPTGPNEERHADANGASGSASGGPVSYE